VRDSAGGLRTLLDSPDDVDTPADLAALEALA
jgi:hypothetical protein